eukprot:15478942-Alexandrium_andersonii.AAC.1
MLRVELPEALHPQPSAAPPSPHGVASKTPKRQFRRRTAPIPWPWGRGGGGGARDLVRGTPPAPGGPKGARREGALAPLGAPPRARRRQLGSGGGAGPPGNCHEVDLLQLGCEKRSQLDQEEVDLNG